MKEKSKLNANLTMNIFSWLSLVLVIIFFGIGTKGALFTGYNLKTIFTQTVLFIVGGLGLSFLFAQGAFDLSFGSGICFSAIITMLVVNKTGSFAMCFITPLVISTLLGLVNGLLYAYSGLVVFIQTLSMSFLLKGLFTTLIGPSGGLNVPAALYTFDSLPITVGITVALTILTVWLFNYTAFGKQCRMVGAGQTATEQSGVNVKRIRLLSFLYAGFVAGIVTIMSMAKAGKVTTSTGSNMEFNIMIALTLGGMPAEGGMGSKLSSVFIGCFITAILSNGMVLLGIGGRMQEVIKGLIFILVLIFSMRMKERAKKIA